MALTDDVQELWFESHEDIERSGTVPKLVRMDQPYLEMALGFRARQDWKSVVSRGCTRLRVPSGA